MENHLHIFYTLLKNEARTIPPLMAAEMISQIVARRTKI